ATASIGHPTDGDSCFHLETRSSRSGWPEERRRRSVMEQGRSTHRTDARSCSSATAPIRRCSTSRTQTAHTFDGGHFPVLPTIPTGEVAAEGLAERQDAEPGHSRWVAPAFG